MEIRVLKTEEEKKEYSRMCKYCFIDKMGWTDHIFGTRRKGETAYGAFENKTLKSGVICKYYTVSIFGKNMEMAGISAVASYPETRNNGFVRALMTQALKDEHKKGTAVSALYPFSFRFYRKFGYGDLTGFWNVSFNPGDITPVDGASPLFPYDGTDEMLNKIRDVRREYYTRFDFGAVPDNSNAETFNGEIAFWNTKVYMAFDGNTPCGVISYTLEASGPYSSELHISSLAYTSRKGLGDIMNHLAAHRDQCSSIKGNFHSSLPLHILTNEPRLQTIIHRSWMARPLHLKTVLEAKLTEGRQFPHLTFSIEDPVIDEETATYRVTPESVEKLPYSGKNNIPLPLFSSLLFGGMTPRQAYETIYPSEWILEASSFFKKNRATYLNEQF